MDVYFFLVLVLVLTIYKVLPAPLSFPNYCPLNLHDEHHCPLLLSEIPSFTTTSHELVIT